MVTIVKKLTGGAYPFYEYACLSTDVKPASLVPENSICHEIDTGKHFYFGNGEWKELPPKGGSGGGSQGGGSGLPEPTRSGNIMQVSDDTGEWEQVAFPLASEDDVGKLIGITGKDGVYKYSSVPAPSGGAEKFVVTLQQDAQTEEWTAADGVTIADIVAADAAGKIVECEYPFDHYSSVIPVNTIISEGGENAVVFTGLAFAIDGTRIVNAIFEGNSVVVDEVPIPTSSNAPLIVTLTAGSTEGQFVGDKTHEEVFNAFVNGQNCVFYAPSVGLAETVKAAEHVTNYAINTGSFRSEGDATDYITVNAG